MQTVAAAYLPRFATETAAFLQVGVSLQRNYSLAAARTT